MNDDPLWGEFTRLWSALAGTSRPVLLAGGYGLFLKQRWLTASPEQRIVIPLAEWRNVVPRATRDLDFLLDLALLADEQQQSVVHRALSGCGYRVRQRIWQFAKDLAGDRQVLVDLHAPEPRHDDPDVVSDVRRVKHRRSSSSERIHGRTNAEAVGSAHGACMFTLDGVTIAVPNPVTWSVMKLTAMDDRWREAQAEDQAEGQTEQRRQAAKHAGDVLRVVAMTTREERDALAPVIAVMRD